MEPFAKPPFGGKPASLKKRADFPMRRTSFEEKRTAMPKPSSLIEIFRTHWWMVTFLSIIALFAWQSSQKQRRALLDLQTRFTSILHEKETAASEFEDLLLQIRAQNDPDWVELVLMRRLGLVPEGQTKVYFEKHTQ